MRYAILIYDENTANPSPEPPPQEVLDQVMADYFGYSKMLRDRGAFVAGEALLPNSTATSIRQRDGEVAFTDGPFAETKEGLGGFYVVEAKDLDEALEFGTACPAVKYGGTVEVRPVVVFDADYADREADRGAGVAQG